MLCPALLCIALVRRSSVVELLQLRQRTEVSPLSRYNSSIDACRQRDDVYNLACSIQHVNISIRITYQQSLQHSCQIHVSIQVSRRLVGYVTPQRLYYSSCRIVQCIAYSTGVDSIVGMESRHQTSIDVHSL